MECFTTPFVMSFSRLCDLLSSSFWNPGGLTGFNSAFKCNWFSDYTSLFLGQISKSMCCQFFPFWITFRYPICCKLSPGVSNGIVIYDTTNLGGLFIFYVIVICWEYWSEMLQRHSKLHLKLMSHPIVLSWRNPSFFICCLLFGVFLSIEPFLPNPF